jgi:hypothetical protein
LEIKKEAIMKRTIALLVVGFFLVFGSGIFATQAGAETLLGSNVDYRITAALRVGQTELQGWLPAPWQVNPAAGGPLKDANLYVIFVDRLLGQDPQGKPAAGGTYRFVALAVPAKNPQTGEVAPFVIRIYAPHEDISLYNPYKNSVKATIRREHSLKGTDLEPGTGSELWELRDKAGGVLQLRMEYQRAVPRRAEQEMKPHSSVEPTFYRIYRIDQGSDLVKSSPAGIDRVKNYQLKVTVSELSKLFDGTEQVVGIIVSPWYVRKYFLP